MKVSPNSSFGKGALHALRQRVAQVGEFLANLVPRFGNLLPGRVVLEQDGNQRLSGACLRAQHVNPGDLLQALLYPFGDLQFDFVGGRTRPQGAHHHCLEGEVGVFGAAEFEVRQDPADHQHDDQIGDQRTMAQGPFREVGRAHRVGAGGRSGAAPAAGPAAGSERSMTRIRSPLLSLCTPATTIRSPARAPLSSTAVSSR